MLVAVVVLDVAVVATVAIRKVVQMSRQGTSGSRRRIGGAMPEAMSVCNQNPLETLDCPHA